MLVTILIHDNTVTIDGRALPIDCSAIDQNIRVVQWYDTFGDIEFFNFPGTTFKANGRIDSIHDLADFQETIDAWQALAAKIDAVPVLAQTTPQQAVTMIEQIEANPVLLEVSLDEAATKLRKIQIDGDLDVATLGLDECIRLYDIIQNEPTLLEVYPGVAVQALQKIEADPELSALPLAEAVDKVRNPPLPPPTPQMLELQAVREQEQLELQVRAQKQAQEHLALVQTLMPPRKS
jgi:hypothetical protein